MTAQQVSTNTKRETAFWRRLIEAACSTVANEPEWLIEAVLLVQHLDQLTAAERDELLSLAYRVAEENGVAARPEPDGDWLAIWFGRGERKDDASAAVRLAYVRPAGSGNGTEETTGE
jgi:hypothetical protein